VQKLIKFTDLSEQFADNKKPILTSIYETLEQSNVYGGNSNKLLENFIKKLYKNANIELTNSGTSALLASLIALDLPKNSRILTTPITYPATSQAILGAGCIPTFVDVDSSWLLDLNDINRVYDFYKDEISAVLVVDLYGQGCDIVQLRQWCDARNLKLIIDAAHSFGLTDENYDQTVADAICCSLNVSKNFGGLGGGGAVITKKINPTKLKAICQVGKEISGPHGRIDMFGLNLKMTAIQSSLISANILQYENRFNRKVDIIKRFYAAFENHDSINLPSISFKNNFNWYIFPIHSDKNLQIADALTAANIEFAAHYKYALHREKFAEKFNPHSCSNAERLTGRIISLPSHPHLTDSNVDYIIEVVLKSL